MKAWYTDIFQNIRLDRENRLAADAWEECLRRERQAIDVAPIPTPFGVTYHTVFGEEICVLGSCEALGGWCLERAVPLHWTDGGVWRGEVSLAAEDAARAEYKYIIRAPGWTFWEPGANRRVDVRRRAPAPGGGGLSMHRNASCPEVWGQAERHEAPTAQ